MLLHALRTVLVVAATAPPFFILLTGCSFGAPQPSKSAGLFVNIERGRECADPSEIAKGINIAKPDEEGFWVGRTSMYGLDYSPAALAACNGMPQKVLFHGPFPEGSHFCVQPDFVPATHPTVVAAAQATCDEEHLIDGDGNPYRCDFVAWPAHRANMLFPNACDSSGMPLTGFQDPRKLPDFKNVAWTGTVNVTVSGSSVTKMSATPDYDAGASASTLLDTSVNGAFEFLATEQDKERTAGFALEPDNDPSDADIIYGIVLEGTGTLRVTEFGQTKMTGAYVANDRFRIVSAGGVVAFYQGETLLYATPLTSTPKLRATVALRDLGATITNARTTF